MGPRWKLTVEGLGKIDHAEVEVRPLMLFVGENNSGKSYLASLLWGLFELQNELGRPPPGPVLTACDEWLTRKLGEHPNAEPFALTEEDRSLFLRLFEETLAASRSRLVSRVFNSKLVDVRRLALEPSVIDRDARVSLMWADIFGSVQAMVYNHGFCGISSHDRSYLLLSIAQRLVFGNFCGPAPIVSRLYLPASRSGFMLLYKAVVKRQMDQLKIADPGELRLNLTLPAINFLNLLALGLTDNNGSYAEEAALLEEPLNGRVELSAGVIGVNEYYYRPAGSQTRLDMSLSSSLVTELAPIILALRHMDHFPVLVLEEPEAHLHPSVQRKLAQVIVRLIRKGLYVWITTHSENFCQQINNFMKLGALDPARRAEAQQKLGYGEQDYLDLDDVTGYQFKLDESGERSIVTELKRKERGLVMPTFNKELLALGEEVDFLDEQFAE